MYLIKFFLSQRLNERTKIPSIYFFNFDRKRNNLVLTLALHPHCPAVPRSGFRFEHFFSFLFFSPLLSLLRMQRCACHSGLNTLGSSQHQVVPFYIQMALCITRSSEILCMCVCAYHCWHMSVPFCLFCALLGREKGGVAYSLFMQVIPLRPSLCQGRASVQRACIL